MDYVDIQSKLDVVSHQLADARLSCLEDDVQQLTTTVSVLVATNTLMLVYLAIDHYTR